MQTAEANRAPAADESSRNQQEQARGQKTKLRVQLLGQLNGILSVRDTPRGLLATVRDVEFSGPVLRRTGVDHVARLAAIVAAYPELRVEVDRHTDSAGTGALRNVPKLCAKYWWETAPANAVVARGSATRLLVSNTSTTGRLENRHCRV
jgi:hypothetical protein